MNSVLCYKCNKKATKHKRKQVLFIPMGFCGKVRNHAGTIGKKRAESKKGTHQWENFASILLQESFFMVRIIGTIGNDNVIEKTYAHGVASLMYAVGEPVIHHTGHNVSARMVMAYSQYGGIT